MRSAADRRKRLGLCAIKGCEEDAAPGRTRCEDHAEVDRIKARERYGAPAVRGPYRCSYPGCGQTGHNARRHG